MGRENRNLGTASALTDAFLLFAAFLIAYRIRTGLSGFPGLESWDRYLVLPFSVMLAWLWIGYAAGLYRGTRLSFSIEVRKLFVTASLTGLTVASAMFLLKQTEISRPLLVLYVLACLIETVAFRLLIAASPFNPARQPHRIIVVGSSAEADEICRSIRGDRKSGLELAGVITEEEGLPIPPGAIRLGDLRQAEAIFRREVVDEVVFAVPRSRINDVEDAFVAAEELGIPTKLCVNFLPNRISRVDFERINGTPVLAFRSTPGRPIELALKRGFDIAISALAMLLGAPLFAFIAIAVKFDSPGPVFFRQRRTGLNGRDFYMLKFRSMALDAEQRLASLASKNEMSGPVFKIKADPRVTRVGRLLRKTSLDELPQFWNVLVGDMSVVGPRPLFDVKQYDQRWQVRRLTVKPGITCTWQISGRNEIDFPTWMKLDLDYIDRWSLALDLKIFLKTIPAVLFGRGAR